jgi:hypothetical protein
VSLPAEGYGSEWHLRQCLTDSVRRAEFDAGVLQAVGGESVTWLVDGPFFFRADGHQYGERRPDGRLAECRGLDFLEPSHAARQEWARVWPKRGNTLNWDAVGGVRVGGADEWLLVEAKAHLGEIESSCGAKQHGGLAQIEAAINRTQNELGIVPRRDWLQGHYQFCNRVVALNHLLAHGVPAHLVFVDFCGDTHFADRAMAPQDWQPSLRALEQHVGRPFPPRVESRLHDVFLNVNPMA